MEFEQYILPELLILIPVLYLVGMALKKSQSVRDSYIPLILGIAGIVLGTLYEVGTTDATAMAVWTGAVQGILCAGASVYASQLWIQRRKRWTRTSSSLSSARWRASSGHWRSLSVR